MCQAVGQVPGSLIDWAAKVIGVPCQVVAAQITDESGGNPAAVSPTGAQGVAQFEPGTWQGLGCPGSPKNVNDAMKCYAKYMYQLLQQYHGNVRNALAAYNAGPGNIQAGYGYADNILAASGQSPGLAASGGDPNAVLTSAQQQQTSAGNDCALSLGGQHIGILFGHGPTLPSACLIRKTEVRAVLGAIILVGGGLIVLPGLVIVLAFGFRASGAASTVAQAASAVSPYGRVVNRVASAPGQRRQRRAQAAARTEQAQAVEVRRGSTEARRAAGGPAQQQRAIRGQAPRRPPPSPAPRAPRAEHHE